MIKVLIFTLPTCAPCNQLKESMRDSNIYQQAEIHMYDMSEPTGDVVDLSVKYNVRSAPTTIVLDKDGAVYYSGTLVRSASKILELVKEVENG